MPPSHRPKTCSVLTTSLRLEREAPDQGSGPEGFIKFFTAFRTAFPDLKIAVEQMVADEDTVAIAYTVTGTQDGPFQGIPATGKQIKARGLQIAKFNSEAKFVECWGSSDELGILQQLGVTKPPAPYMNRPSFRLLPRPTKSSHG